MTPILFFFLLSSFLFRFLHCRAAGLLQQAAEPRPLLPIGEPPELPPGAQHKCEIFLRHAVIHSPALLQKLRMPVRVNLKLVLTEVGYRCRITPQLCTVALQHTVYLRLHLRIPWEPVHLVTGGVLV